MANMDPNYYIDNIQVNITDNINASSLSVIINIIG